MNGWLTIKTKLVNGELKQGLKDIAKSLSGAKEEASAMIKKFAKLALIIGVVVGLFKLIQGGMKTLLEKNKELNAKIENIKNAVSNLMQGLFNAMANILEPIITRLVDWMYKFMSYLNVVTKEFFNLDLFAKNTSKSLKSGAKSAKEIKKSLAGFDEMNIIGDKSSTGGAGGGSSNYKVPEIDTAKFEQQVKEFRDGWKSIMDITLKEATKTFLSTDGVWGVFKLGLFWIEQGFTKTFNGILKLLKGEFKEGIVLLLSGIGTLILGTLTNVYGFFYGFWVKIRNLISTIIEIIVTPITSALASGKKAFSQFYDAVKDVVKGIAKLFKGDLNDAIKSFKSAFKKIMDSLWTIAKAPLNMMIDGINAIIKGLNKIKIEVPDWVPSIGGKSWGFSIKSIPKLEKGGIVSNPGRGVLMGSYIAGEKGAEAVLPLTDDTLQRLASMIPITIDLTNTIDGRVLNRRLETIRMNDSFAGNR